MASPARSYNRNTSLLVQPNNWACSVFSATMALNAVGQPFTWQDIRAKLGPRVTTEFGLMNSSGVGLVDLFGECELQAGSIPNSAAHGQGASWADVVARAGRMPVLLGGQAWNHWTFVREASPSGVLRLGNPAPNWQSVGQEMDHDEFDAWGRWSLVWINVELEEEEDPVRIAELEDQLRHLQVQTNGLITALAHVTDVIVPELANPQTSAPQREALKAAARTIRVQFIGPVPG
jgi:hypothetical protein